MVSILGLSALLSTATALSVPVNGVSAPVNANVPRVTNQYAPVPATCPTGSLVRAASGLCDKEESYRDGRKSVADIALAEWLKKTNPAFSTNNLPTVSTMSRYLHCICTYVVLC